MSVPDTLLCMFNARVEEQDGSHVIEIPENEIASDNLEANQAYRVAVLPSIRGAEPEPEPEPQPQSEPARRQESREPPVEEGDTVEVEIEDIGEQGDGIARVGPGYVVIVPDTGLGERVTVEITEARDNVAFAEVVERQDRFG